MPKLERFEVVFEPNQEICFAGHCLQGKLVIVLNTDMTMRGVRVRFRGKAHVYWSEGSEDSERMCVASEEYFDQTEVVLGRAPQETNDTVVLPAGQHIFPFNFMLPCGLPSSFEGKYDCYIRYWVEGIIDKPWKFDHRVKMPFTVVAILDLNQEPDALNSAQVQDSKTVCCCCCESGPVTCVFRIDRIGYVPGESIVCNAEITNNCNRVIWSSKVQLYMMKVDVADTPYDLELPVKIIIGTIPIQSVVQQYNMYGQPLGAPVQGSQTITAQPRLDMPSSPPPTYQESFFGKSSIRDNDDEHTYGDLNYAPAYTYYNWN